MKIKNILLKINIILLLLVGEMRSSEAQKNALPDRIESEFTFMGGLMFIQVEINGKTGWILVDTGSNGTLILNSTYFEGKDTGAKASGMTGAQAVQSVQVDSLKWANVELKGQIFPAMNLQMLASEPGESVLGLMGSGFLKAYQVQFNFERRQMTLTKKNEIVSEVIGLTPTIVLPFQMIGGFPVSQATVKDNVYRFVMDTGATDNILDTSLESVISDIWKESGQVAISDAGGGEGYVRRGNLSSLVVGGISMNGIQMSLKKMPEFDIKNQIYGILGFQFFKYFLLDFDYPNGLIKCYDMQQVMKRANP